jgi:PAS domain S-box-containing protein
MKDEHKTKAQLIDELVEMRQRVTELETAEAASLPEKALQGKSLRDLIEIIHFTENIAAKIHGLLDEAEIYRTVNEEFARSRRYTASITLLTDDGLRLRIVGASIPSRKLKAAEKASRLRIKNYRIDLNKSGIFSQVVREGRTIRANVSDIVAELFPQQLAGMISKLLGYERKWSILTPLKRLGEIVGVFAMSSTDLAEYFIPSAKNLAQHISTALDLADEHAERQQAEKALQKAYDESETQVEQRTAELARANEGLQAEIAERKRAEEALRRSEREKATILGSLSEHVLYQDLEMRVVWANRAAGESVGLASRKLVGRHCYEIWSQRGEPCVGCPVVKARDTGRSQQAEMTTPDGRVWRVRGYPVRDAHGDVAGAVEVTQEITERKRAEEALRESEDRYRMLSELTSDFTYIMRVEPDGTLVGEWVTDAFARITGFAPDELEPRGAWERLIHPDDLPTALQTVQQMLSNQSSVAELRITTKAGEVRWLRFHGRPVWDETEKRVTLIVGAVQDINERKRAEEALRESEERFRTIVETAPSVLHITDAKGNNVYVSPNCEQIVGYTQEELHGRLIRWVHEDDVQRAREVFEHAYREGVGDRDFEFKAVKKNGDVWHASSSWEPLKGRDGQFSGFVVQTTDITERKQAEEALRRRGRELALLNRAGQAFNSTLDLDQVLVAVLEEACFLLNATASSVWLIEPETGELACRHATGPQSGAVRGWRLAPGQGFAGWVARSDQSLVVPDIQADERHFTIYEKTGLALRSIISVPLRVKEGVIGVIHVADAEVDRFGDMDLELLEPLAATAAIAIENARLYAQAQQEITERKRAEEEIARRAEELVVLNELAQALTARLDIEEILEEAYRGVSRLLDTTNFYIALYDSDRDEVTLAIDVTEGEVRRPLVSRCSGQGLTEYIVHSRTPVLIQENLPDRLEEMGIEPIGRSALSWLGVPLITGDRVLGVMAVQSYAASHAYDEQDLNMLTAITSQAAVALENARLYEQAQQEIAERKRAEEALERRLGQLGALSQASRAVTASLELDQVLAEIVSLASGVVASDYTGVVLVDEAGNVSRSIENLPGVPALNHRIREEGLTRWIFRSREAVVVDEIREDGTMEPALDEGAPRSANPYLAEAGVKSVAGLPLMVKNRLLGVLYLHSLRAGAFRDQLPLLTAFANQAAIAIENGRLFQAEREQRELAEALTEAAASVSSTLELERMLNHILEQVERVVAGDAFNIMLIEEEDDVRMAGWRGYERLDKEISGATFPIAKYPNLLKMIQTGEPVVTPDTATDPNWVPRERQEWLRSYVGAPIQVGGLTVGFLNVDSTQSEQFGPEDARRLKAFASHVAAAVENAQLYAEQQHRAEEASMLLEISNAINSTLEPTLILKEVALRAARACRAARCTIFLLDEHGETLRPITSQFASGRADRKMWQLFKEARAPWRLENLPQANQVVRERRPLLILDARASFLPRQWVEPFDLRSVLVVPLVSRERVAGLMALDHPEPGHMFTHEQINLAMTIGGQAAVAIENAQLYGELRDHAERLEQRVQERTAQIQAQYARQEAILRSASDGIVVADTGGEVLQVNPVADAWLTRTLSPQDADRLREAAQTLAQHAEKRPKETLELTGLDLELEAAPISEPKEGEAAAVVSIHDVSHLKALDRMKSRFVTNVSHELRTPVTTIKLYAELMQRNPEKWQEYLATLVQEADRQARLVEDILQISRIDTGRLEMKPHPTSLNKLTTAAVARHQALAQERGLTIEHLPAKSDPLALADPDRMAQVLANLMTNAVQYTSEGGQVTVSTGKEKAEGRVWAVTKVVDTGMGIPAQELPHVFERFFRGSKPRSMQISGTGLGLAIAKEIAELHGGRVTVESEVGVGTTFTIWLPLAEE